MQFFYVTKDVTLRYGNRELVLTAPPKELLDRNSLSPAHVRCGFIAWEAIKAREALGTVDAAVILPSHHELLRFLPPMIASSASGGCLFKQLEAIAAGRPAEKRSAPIRIALVNGFGTMLGDNLIGVSALEQALSLYKEKYETPIEVHAFLAWNAIPGAEVILARSPVITYVQAHSATLDELRSFDAYWDFSSLLTMSGYDSVNFQDFYLDHLGIDPSLVGSDRKIPSVRVTKSALKEAQEHLAYRAVKRPLIFMQFKASTDARSVPSVVAEKLVRMVLDHTDSTILCAQTDWLGSHSESSGRVVNLGDWTVGNLDRYVSLLALSDLVVSVDTLALHIAMGLRRPGLGLFALSRPELRLTYAPNIDGFLIPGAETLPYWGKHKGDSKWESLKGFYVTAWNNLDIGMFEAILKRKLGEIVPSSRDFHV